MSLLLSTSVAQAEVPPAGSPLTLREAVQQSLKRNPDLKVFGFSLRAQDARALQAKLRPAPELSVEVENILGSGETKGTDAAEATFALSQVIELGD
ncbi:MAG: TolC family protein, partial [Nevskiales bacterium]